MTVDGFFFSAASSISGSLIDQDADFVSRVKARIFLLFAFLAGRQIHPAIAVICAVIEYLQASVCSVDGDFERLISFGSAALLDLTLFYMELVQ